MACNIFCFQRTIWCTTAWGPSDSFCSGQPLVCIQHFCTASHCLWQQIQWQTPPFTDSPACSPLQFFTNRWRWRSNAGGQCPHCPTAVWKLWLWTVCDSVHVSFGHGEWSSAQSLRAVPDETSPSQVLPKKRRWNHFPTRKSLLFKPSMHFSSHTLESSTAYITYKLNILRSCASVEDVWQWYN